MALQKRVVNSRYKPFYKQWLIDNGVRVYLDGIDTTDIPTKDLNRDYKTLEVYQWSNKKKKYLLRKPVPNTAFHMQGELVICTYYQVNITSGDKGKRVSEGLPLHRIVYVWFNDVIYPYNENNEKMEIMHNNGDSSNNHISNLRWDTAKQNRAERKGYVNQWGKRK